MTNTCHVQWMLKTKKTINKKKVAAWKVSHMTTLYNLLIFITKLQFNTYNYSLQNVTWIFSTSFSCTISAVNYQIIENKKCLTDTFKHCLHLSLCNSCYCRLIIWPFLAWELGQCLIVVKMDLTKIILLNF